MLIGYLPIPKLSHITHPDKRSLETWRLFHDSMERLLKPLVDAGVEGVDTVCADRQRRRVHPIVASYVADFPEQCLIAGIKNSHCPICLCRPEHRGSGTDEEKRAWRTPEDALDLMEDWWERHASAGAEQLGYKKIWPFWWNLPHQNIFHCFTPDILHQLHKGNFKDHLVKWCLKHVPEKVIDQRFKAMTPFTGLKHFAKGISRVKQWSGTEYKNMEKIFLSVIDGIMPPQAIKASQALLDFMHLARYSTHTDKSLALMTETLKDYHELKAIFIEIKACDTFETIPKLHAISHYVDLIKLKGTADGYNTESPERLHIDFAKVAYRASNKVRPTKQMTLWLQRQEAMNKKSAYVSWVESFYAEQRRRERDEWEVEGLNEDAACDVDAIPEPVLRSIQVSGNPRHLINASPSTSRAIADAAITYHAPDLLSTIRTFLSLQISPQIGSHVKSSQSIDIWHRTRIKVALPPSILYDDDDDKPDVVAAQPVRPKTKWTPARDAKFDTALMYRFPDEIGLERKLNNRCILIVSIVKIILNQNTSSVESDSFSRCPPNSIVYSHLSHLLTSNSSNLFERTRISILVCG